MDFAAYTIDSEISCLNKFSQFELCVQVFRVVETTLCGVLDCQPVSTSRVSHFEGSVNNLLR